MDDEELRAAAYRQSLAAREAARKRYDAMLAGFPAAAAAVRADWEPLRLALAEARSPLQDRNEPKDSPYRDGSDETRRSRTR